MNETKMAQTLKKKLVHLNCGIDKIETGSTQIGVPDLYIRTLNHDLWIELKEIRHWPIRFSTLIQIPWRPGQLYWIQQHQKRGGNAFLCFTHQDEWFLFKNIKLEYDQRELLALSLIPIGMSTLEPERLLEIIDSNCR